MLLNLRRIDFPYGRKPRLNRFQRVMTELNEATEDETLRDWKENSWDIKNNRPQCAYSINPLYDFFADLNFTSGITSNSFYWFLCEVGARSVSYFFQFWSFGGGMALKGPKSPLGAISRSGGFELVEQYETRVEQVRAHPG